MRSAGNRTLSQAHSPIEFSASDVTVILPAYNEADSVADVIARVRRISPDFHILVVDDGSSDRTSDAARLTGASVITHEGNIGNGAAVKTGIRAARTSIVVLMDADGQHPPEAIPKLLEVLQNSDMVVGSRSASSQSAFRHFGNFILNRFAQFLAGRQILDLTSGFRAARRDALLEYVHLFPNEFSYPTTSTIAFLKGGYRIVFLPVEGMERRRTGVSKIRPFRDGFKFLTIIVRLALLFDPIRVFVPVGLFLFLGGAVRLIYQAINDNRIEEHSLLLVLSGLIILFVGFIADLVASLTTKRKS